MKGNMREIWNMYDVCDLIQNTLKIMFKKIKIRKRKY